MKYDSGGTLQTIEGFNITKQISIEKWRLVHVGDNLAWGITNVNSFAVVSNR